MIKRYCVYDKNGKLDFFGTFLEISEHYKFDIEAVKICYNQGIKLRGEYSVVDDLIDIKEIREQKKTSDFATSVLYVYDYIYEKYKARECVECFGRNKDSFSSYNFTGNVRIKGLTEVLDVLEKEIVCEAEGFVYGGDFDDVLDSLKEDYEEEIKYAIGNRLFNNILKNRTSLGTIESLIVPLEKIGFKFSIQNIEW